MNKKELDFILQEGEGFRIEFKESPKHLDSEIVAFANASGGRIFLCITDKGEVKGIKLTNELKSQIQDLARNCDPTIEIKVSSFDNIAVIDIPESDQKPHKCSAGFYLRKGANSQKMSSQEIITFIFEQGKTKFDTLLNRKFKLSDIDINILNKYLRLAGVVTSLSPRESLFNLGVIDEHDIINNAGILFFSNNPRKYFIHAYVTCARYLGNDKVKILDRKDFSGDLVSQID